MPYKSRQQQRFLHAAHPEIAARWDRETNFKKKLPLRVKKKKVTEGTTGIASALMFKWIIEAKEVYWENPGKTQEIVKAKVNFDKPKLRHKLGIGKKSFERNNKFMKTMLLHPSQGATPTATMAKWAASSTASNRAWVERHPEYFEGTRTK